jgi:hypothetical protein
VHSFIPEEQVARLAASLRATYPTVESTEVADMPNMLKGKYLKITEVRNGYKLRRYLGIDHSGMDAEDDELWAAAFALYCEGFEFSPCIRNALEEIIARLKNRTTPPVEA